MEKKSSQEIRETFLRFFEEKKHLRIPGASIVPKSDPTLLFINSGMAPLKPYFTGEAIPEQSDLCNVQPCIRTIDIDDVGDRHHLTLFEMLGSWSIDGYFKETAIKLAYDLLVNYFGFDPKRLVVSVYKGNEELGLEPDLESAEVWRSLGFDDDHISFQDHKDNFWGPAGETGPCGPCTEVFFDTGEAHGPTYKAGGHFDDTNRYIEIWNAGVFMEFNRESDGHYSPLKFKSVDTGSGLERMAMVINGHDTVYETDLLQPILSAITNACGNITLSIEQQRILTDHMRALSFMLAEKIYPSNEGRGYIPRRLIRKCLVLLHQVGATSIQFDPIFDAIQSSLGASYPILKENDMAIRTAFQKEKDDFERVLHDGLGRLEELCAEESPKLSGQDMFILVSTYGFPPDLIREFVAKKNGSIDESGYQAAFAEHQAISKATKQVDNDRPSIDLRALENLLSQEPPSQFTGYDNEQDTGHITTILEDSRQIQSASEGQTVIVVCDTTCFYAESGGQVGDTGTASSQNAELEILDTKKTAHGVFVHIAKITEGTITCGDELKLKIDSQRRTRLRHNHSATHLLQSALREVLGDNIKQAGSLVEPNRLRFDFHCDHKANNDQLHELDRIVNRHIQTEYPLETMECPMKEALEKGAIAFFEDKYGDIVRVVKYGDISVELCGGTHTANTKEIDYFKIISEGSVGKGTRRITAITGTDALDYFKAQTQTLTTLSTQLGCPINEVQGKIQTLAKKKGQSNPIVINATPNTLDYYLEQDQLLSTISKTFNTPINELPKRIEALQNASKETAVTHLEKSIIDSHIQIHENGYQSMGYYSETPIDGLRDEACRIAAMINGAVCLLAKQDNGQAQLAIAVTKSCANDINAKTLVTELAPVIGGRGGGKDHLAMGAGPNLEAIPDLLATFQTSIKNLS